MGEELILLSYPSDLSCAAVVLGSAVPCGGLSLSSLRGRKGAILACVTSSPHPHSLPVPRCHGTTHTEQPGLALCPERGAA